VGMPLSGPLILAFVCSFAGEQGVARNARDRGSGSSKPKVNALHSCSIELRGRNGPPAFDGEAKRAPRQIGRTSR
jgi:hypothetical protein